jgi:Ca2+-binding RTX toxin-like protein
VPYRIDLVNGSAGRDTAMPDTLAGGSGADRLDGDGNANILIGNGGNDTLAGAAGADRLEGGAGNDIYVVDNPADVVIEVAGGGVTPGVTVTSSASTVDRVESPASEIFT